MKKYTIGETFVGAGGNHIGFKENGFITKYVNDINKDCLSTLKLNNPEIENEAYIDMDSILNLDGYEILKKTDMEIGEMDVFFGGIVCKGFSMAGEKSPVDERNYFYHKQLELVNVIRPKISIIENVTGILSAQVLNPKYKEKFEADIIKVWSELENAKRKKVEIRKQGFDTSEIDAILRKKKQEKDKLKNKLVEQKAFISVIDEIKQIHKNIGYDFYIERLNTAWYGSSTKRERVIIVGIRNDLKVQFHYPKATHYSPSLKTPFLWNANEKYMPVCTVNDALAKISVDKSDLDNIPMNHNPKTIKRFSYIPEGKNVVDVMDALPNELKVSKFYSRGSTMRLNGSEPSPTLVPGHSNFPVHPKFNRSITVREAATITGFPLDYKFIGNHSKRCEHVGNAVPIHLSRALAQSCILLLNEYYKQIS